MVQRFRVGSENIQVQYWNPCIAIADIPCQLICHNTLFRSLMGELTCLWCVLTQVNSPALYKYLVRCPGDCARIPAILWRWVGRGEANHFRYTVMEEESCLRRWAVVHLDVCWRVLLLSLTFHKRCLSVIGSNGANDKILTGIKESQTTPKGDH